MSPRKKPLLPDLDQRMSSVPMPRSPWIVGHVSVNQQLTTRPVSKGIDQRVNIVVSKPIVVKFEYSNGWSLKMAVWEQSRSTAPGIAPQYLQATSMMTLATSLVMHPTS